MEDEAGAPGVRLKEAAMRVMVSYQSKESECLRVVILPLIISVCELMILTLFGEGSR
jgi:hypothetical protein